MKARLFVLAFVVALVGAIPARADDLSKCAAFLPFGTPTISGHPHTSEVCHKGYAALVDDDFLVPVWVAYELTLTHSLGCLKRTDDFHEETQITKGRTRADPDDYAQTSKDKFDRGHLAPADDFSWGKDVMHDSFSMANMTPQVHAFNAGRWEALENAVRSFTLKHHKVLIYVGSIVPKNPHTIGMNNVAVPTSFWKIVVDPASGDALAYVMPHKRLAGQVKTWLTTVDAVERASGVRVPMPRGFDTSKASEQWETATKDWRARKDAKCSRAH